MVGHAGSSERVGEVEKSDFSEVGVDGASFEKAGELVGVDSDEADQEVNTGGEGTVLDDIV